MFFHFCAILDTNIIAFDNNQGVQKLSKKQLQAVQIVVQVVIQTTQTVCRLKPELSSTKRAIRIQEHL